MPIFTNPSTKKITEIPETITDANGKELIFIKPKAAGFSVGGWYKYKDDDQETLYLAKFGYDGFPYAEKLFNDLARIVVGNEFVPSEVLVGHGMLEGQSQPCLLTAEIKGYQDIIKAGSGKNLVEAAKAKKERAQAKFHRFFTFSGLLAYDDLNEENLGLDDEGTPFIIDYGIEPNFLLDAQIPFAATPFYLASLIGHRSLTGMALVRRRYFGHDDFLDPRDRLKPQKDKLKIEDISYGEILLQCKKIIDSESKMQRAIAKNLEEVTKDKTLSEEQKKAYAQKYSLFAKILEERISWIKTNFSEDLQKISDKKEKERFDAIKWRLHPKFQELMKYEYEVFRKCAHADLQSNINELAEFLDDNQQCKTREDILKFDLKNIEKLDIQEWARDKFIIHNALVAGDLDMVKWLATNEICDPNLTRRSRTHSFQLFGTTPLHAAISIYHDALFYERKEDLEPLTEIIKILTGQFVKENGESFDKTKNYKEGVRPFDVEVTFIAMEKYKTLTSPEAQAATTIQRAFKSHKAKKVVDTEPQPEK